MPNDEPPLTSTNIAHQLAKLARQLDELMDELKQAEKDAIYAREAHTTAYDKAFMAADGAMELRKHQASLDSSEQRVAAELATAQVRDLKQRVESVRLRVEIGRSLNAALRAETGLAGSGGTP